MNPVALAFNFALEALVARLPAKRWLLVVVFVGHSVVYDGYSWRAGIIGGIYRVTKNEL